MATVYTSAARRPDRHSCRTYRMPQRSLKRRTFRAPDPARRDGHAPFLEVLGRVRARTPRWYRCRAGLMVLELLDRVWSTRRRSTTIGLHRRLAIRRAVAKVRPKATRVVLDQVLHLVAPGTGPHAEALAALMEYGKRLQYESEFRLASHVYMMVIDYAAQIGHTSVLPDAYERHGRCMSERGSARAAMASYATGLALAARHRNVPARLQIAVAKAELYCSLKDSSSACRLLDPLLPRARKLGNPKLLMEVLHVRANVAHNLGDDLQALVFFAGAFENCQDLKHGGRLLNDMALTLLTLGFISEARKAFLVSSSSTRGDSFAKWAAMINLMMLAHRRRDEAGFDQYRRMLEPAPMSARLLVAYWREVADGSSVFSRRAEAQAAYRRAAGYAARYGYFEEGKELDRLLKGELSPSARVPRPPANLPVSAQELLEKVRMLRSLPEFLSRTSSGDANTSSVTGLRTTLKRGPRPRAAIV